jgi:hypothetical protein
MRIRIGNEAVDEISSSAHICLDPVEKAAYVIRNIAVSGFVGQDLDTVSEEPAVGEPLKTRDRND